MIGSLLGFTGAPTRTGYSASKHALMGFYDSLRIELMGTGVDITMVAPDFVVTEIHKRSDGPDGTPLGETPMQESKIMTAEECAAMILRGMPGAEAPRDRLAAREAGPVRADLRAGRDRPRGAARDRAGPLEREPHARAEGPRRLEGRRRAVVRARDDVLFGLVHVVEQVEDLDHGGDLRAADRKIFSTRASQVMANV